MNRLYVQLGRAGDILNVLPLCLRDFNATGLKPVLMIAEPYRTILDGVSYVEPLVFKGEFEDVDAAVRIALRIGRERGLAVIPTQIYGNNLTTTEKCTSFMRESWTKAPGSPAWGSLPLIFDRRDLSREKGVKAQLLRRSTGKPYIVAALSGTSSPFAHSQELLRYLRSKLGNKFDVVDVSGFTAPRFYDLLTLLEDAAALLTVDSGLLHLAAAVPFLRVVPFITREPSPWHGSPWRPQHVARFYYDEAPECFAAVLTALEPRDPPAIWHVWSHYERGPIDPETLRRIAFARKTWESEWKLTNWAPCEFSEQHASRDSGDAEILDPRPIPFQKDVINRVGFEGPADDDIIAWTNADVCFVPGLTGLVLDVIRRKGCAFTHRWDFHEPLVEPLVSEAQAKEGEWYMGSDAFFFTSRWWRKHRDEYPDMLLGREQNDEILRQLVKRHGGLEIRASIYHEKHASYWEHHGNRTKNPGNVYNQRLARKWFLKTGYGPNDPTWWNIPSP